MRVLAGDASTLWTNKTSAVNYATLWQRDAPRERLNARQQINGRLVSVLERFVETKAAVPNEANTSHTFPRTAGNVYKSRSNLRAAAEVVLRCGEIGAVHIRHFSAPTSAPTDNINVTFIKQSAASVVHQHVRRGQPNIARHRHRIELPLSYAPRLLRRNEAHVVAAHEQVTELAHIVFAHLYLGDARIGPSALVNLQDACRIVAFTFFFFIHRGHPMTASTRSESMIVLKLPLVKWLGAFCRSRYLFAVVSILCAT